MVTRKVATLVVGILKSRSAGEPGSAPSDRVARKTVKPRLVRKAAVACYTAEPGAGMDDCGTAPRRRNNPAEMPTAE